MCNKENLPNRVEKAKAASKFAKVLTFDPIGRPTEVLVPGTEGKQYLVRFNRSNGFLQATCENVTTLPHRQCISHAKVPCYHVMAAIEVCARIAKHAVVWCSNEADTKNLNNIHKGQVFNVSMIPTDSKMYGISV